jgi:hypothetical protein
MEGCAKRVEKLLSSSATVLTNHLLAKASFALSICRLAQHHAGGEQSEQLNMALRVYCEIDEFSYRRDLVFTQELADSMHRLQLELRKFGLLMEPPVHEKSKVLRFYNNKRQA